MMVGNTREFIGCVMSSRLTYEDVGGETVVAEAHSNIHVPSECGLVPGFAKLPIADDAEGARGLVGKWVRLTVEVLDG